MWCIGGIESLLALPSWNLDVPPHRVHYQISASRFYWGFTTTAWLNKSLATCLNSISSPLLFMEVRLAQSSNHIITQLVFLGASTNPSPYHPEAIQGPTWSHFISITKTLRSLRKFQGFLELCQELRIKSRYSLYYIYHINKTTLSFFFTLLILQYF